MAYQVEVGPEYNWDKDLSASPGLTSNDGGEFTPLYAAVGTPQPEGVVAGANARIPEGTVFKLLFDKLPGTGAESALISQGWNMYIPIYQAVGDNNATGTINLRAVREWCLNPENIGSTVEDGTYIMVDFENPYFHHIYDYPIDSDEFQKSTRELISVIQAVKALYPNAKVGHYGIPVTHYWFTFINQEPLVRYNSRIHGPTTDWEGLLYSRNWYSVNEEEKEVLINEYLDRNSRIMEAMDWFNPNCYDRYDSDVVVHNTTRRGMAKQYCYNQVEICQRFKDSSGSTAETIPAVSSMYWKIGQLEYNKKQIPTYDLLRDQIDGNIEHTGCNGLAFWHGMSYWVKDACTNRQPPEPGDNPGPYTQWQESRTAFTKDYFNGTEPDWLGFYNTDDPDGPSNP